MRLTCIISRLSTNRMPLRGYKSNLIISIDVSVDYSIFFRYIRVFRVPRFLLQMITATQLYC